VDYVAKCELVGLGITHNLVDVREIGSDCTWNNQRNLGERCFCSTIDKVLGNQNGFQSFQMILVNVVKAENSNNLPSSVIIVLEVTKDEKPFKILSI